MWFVIILIVVIALVVGPVMQMRPTQAQKQKESFRSRANTLGIRFSIKNLPQVNDKQGFVSVPVYFFPPNKSDSMPGWLLVRTSYEHEIHFLTWWEWQGDERATPNETKILTTYLPTMPDSVKAVSVGKEGICVYWDETGTNETLENIIKLLTALKELHKSS